MSAKGYLKGQHAVFIFVIGVISFQIRIVQTSLRKVSGHIAKIRRSSKLGVLPGGKISRNQGEFCWVIVLRSLKYYYSSQSLFSALRLE